MTDSTTESRVTRSTSLPELDPDYRTPDQEMAMIGSDVPDAAQMSISQINPHNPHLFAQHRWHDHFERLRDEDPVHFNELASSGRYWSVCKYADIKAVETDWRTYSSASGISLGAPIDQLPPPKERVTNFIAMDPPEHRNQRRTVMPSVQPRHLQNVEPMIRERTVEVLDSLPEGETFDWVDLVSVELTTRMLATMFDFPFDDRRKLTRWSDIVFAVAEPGGVVESNEQRRAELLECVEYFSRLWEERRANPGHDLVSMLVHGEATRDMTPMQQLGNILLLIVGGNDTTRNTMSGSVYGLDRFPRQYDKLIADPDLIRNMVQEIIRWQTPLPYMRRTATRDVELSGQQIRKDDQVLLWYISANRDTDVFDDPDVINIERDNAAQHLAFGFGIHRCMGSRLAEMQLRILWEEILDRFERVEVVGEATRTFSSFVHGYTELPVQITRT